MTVVYCHYAGLTREIKELIKNTVFTSIFLILWQFLIIKFAMCIDKKTIRLRNNKTEKQRYPFWNKKNDL